MGELSAHEQKYAPDKLYLDGDEKLLSQGLRVSVVGSRKVSESGASRARAVTKALVRHGFVVVSGLAEGVDTIAHKTAIESGGRTIAVLGTELSKCYPKTNQLLLETIKRNHLAISQFAEGYPSRKDNFPRRNRTMALISDATIIVEASERSGTRHQGWEAIRLGRVLYIMQSVMDDPKLTWPRQMMGYGAQSLTRDDMPDALLDIPSFTSGGSFAF